MCAPGHASVPDLCLFAFSIFPPGPPGPLVTSWTEMLKADCPSCPWWPETRPLPEGGDPLDNIQGLFEGGKIRMSPELHRGVFADPTIPQVGPRKFPGCWQGLRSPVVTRES